MSLIEKRLLTPVLLFKPEECGPRSWERIICIQLELCQPGQVSPWMWAKHHQYLSIGLETCSYTSIWIPALIFPSWITNHSEFICHMVITSFLVCEKWKCDKMCHVSSRWPQLPCLSFGQLTWALMKQANYFTHSSNHPQDFWSCHQLSLC